MDVDMYNSQRAYNPFNENLSTISHNVFDDAPPANDNRYASNPPMPAIVPPVKLSTFGQSQKWSREAEKEPTGLRDLLCTDPERLKMIERATLEVTEGSRFRTGLAGIDWVNALFPLDAILPSSAGQLRSSGVWDDLGECFTADLDRLDLPGVEDFLNGVSDRIGTVYGVIDEKGRLLPEYEGRVRRSWLNRTPCKCSTPSVSLLSFPTTGTWGSIQAVAEVTALAPTPNITKVIQRAIVEKAYLMLESQPHRRFVLGLAFFGPIEKVSWSLSLVDRAGIITTETFDLDGAGGPMLGRVLAALSYGPPEAVGLDLSMDVHPVTEKFKTITVHSLPDDTSTPVTRTFTPVRLIHRSNRLVGEGTRVWLVKETQNDRVYVLKDSWELSTRRDPEIASMKRIQKALLADSESHQRHGYSFPELFASEDIGDSTAIRRCMLEPTPSDQRMHQRIVTKYVGDSLTTFQSKYEFVKIILDIVNFLEFCAEKAGIVHGDISISNIMIHRPNASNSSTTEAYGLLIDYNSAKLLEDVEGIKTVTGTIPYIPLDALSRLSRESFEFRHTPGHDLESLLYVILVVCTYTTGPGALRKPIPDEESIDLNHWFCEPSRLASGRSHDLISFQFCVASQMPKYWDDFAPYLERLIDSCWEKYPYSNTPNIATHAKFTQILTEALEMYRGEQPPALDASMDSRKRRRSVEIGDIYGSERNSKVLRADD